MWKDVLRDFWEPFQDLVYQTWRIPDTEIEDKLDPLVGRHFFSVQARVYTDFRMFLAWQNLWLLWLVSVSENALTSCVVIAISGLHSVDVT